MSSTASINSGVGRVQDNHIPLKKAATPEADKKRLFQAAKEIESLFIYYILKAMRSTVPETEMSKGLGFGGGLGKDIYTQIFDEELSKKISGNGEKSLANLLYKSLESRVGESEKAVKDNLNTIKEVMPKAKFVKINQDDNTAIPINKTENTPLEIKEKMPSVQSSSNVGITRKIITHDSEQSNTIIKGGKSDKKIIQNDDSNATHEENNSAISNFGDIINEASSKYRLSPELLETIIMTESSGNPKAVSSAGAKGLMQLADTTASDMGVKNVFDPEENIHAGAKYLRVLIDRFGDLKKALAAYNAGPETVKRYNGIPPYSETRKYVQTVMNALPDKINYYE
jgi:Rod binding domain-containing protein